MLVSIIFLSPFVPACLSAFGCAGWVGPCSCSLPLPHAVSCSHCHPDPTPAPVPPVVTPAIRLQPIRAPALVCMSRCSFGQPCSCTSALCAAVHVLVPPFIAPAAIPAPVPAVAVPPFVWAARSCTSPHSHFVPPFVCLCRCPFVLMLIGASLVLIWLSFALVCSFVLVCACSHLFGLLCLQNT